MAVRIRMKKLGRAHRAFFRICAMDKRSPRDGRVLEELGTYDPSVADTDARAILNKDRVAYWLGVGAQPSEKVAVLIKKYGPGGTHEDAQAKALEKMAGPKVIPDPGPAASKPKSEEEKAAEAEAAAAPPADEPADKPADESAEASTTEESSGEEKKSAEEAPAADA